MGRSDKENADYNIFSKEVERYIYGILSHLKDEVVQESYKNGKILPLIETIAKNVASRVLENNKVSRFLDDIFDARSDKGARLLKLLSDTFVHGAIEAPYDEIDKFFDFDMSLFRINFLPKEVIEGLYEVIEPEIPKIAKWHADFYGIDVKELTDNFFFLTEEEKGTDNNGIEIRNPYSVYKQKYALKDIDGNLIDNSVYTTFARVALTIAISSILSKKIHAIETEADDKSNLLIASYDDTRNATAQFGVYFAIMSLGLAVGAGRIMANAGAGEFKPNTTLINCTVMKQIPDSMEGIMDVLKEAALTLKTGSGVGYAFSSIRPKGAPVRGAGASTSGVLSFMDIYDSMCHTIESAGGRRGAQMATLHDAHPEIFDYIVAKQTPGRLRMFNLSILASDRFMEAVQEDKDWDLWFWEPYMTLYEAKVHKDVIELVYSDVADTYYIFDKDGNKHPLALITEGYTPYDYPEYDYFVFDESHQEYKYGNATASDGTPIIFKKRVYKTVKAKELYDKIMEATYEFGEPGIIFYDTMNKMNPFVDFENLIATNPCSETNLPPSGSCLLGSLYLHRFVNKPFSEQAKFDFGAFLFVTYVWNEFLDNVNILTGLPLPSLRREAFLKRRHGLGFTGLADAMAALGLRYGDNHDSLEFIKTISASMEYMSMVIANTELAKKYGENAFVQRYEKDDNLKGYVAKTVFNSKYMRHLIGAGKNYYSKFIKPEAFVSEEDFKIRYTQATSVAPTGTISFTFGNNCANGIEPAYAITAFRNIIVPGKKTKQMVPSNYFIGKWYKARTGIDLSTLPTSEWPEWAVTVVSGKLTIDDHIKVQQAVQKFTSQSISKTVNIPPDYPFEDFKKLYMDAWKFGIKGVTSFKFNPAFSVGVLTPKEILEQMEVTFVTEDGETITVPALAEVEYDGETHVAVLLFEALKEGAYGKY